MLSRLTYNIELVAEATTNSITVLIRDSLTIIGLIGYLFYLNWQLTLLRDAGGAADRLAGAQRQPALPPLQRAHPELDGRRHARGQGSARRRSA